MIDKLKRYVDTCRSYGEAHAPGEQGQALNTVLSLVIAGIALVIGVYVFSEVESSMDYTAGGHVDNIVSDLYGAYGMTPIVLLVLVAGAIIAVLTQFR